MSLIPDTVVFQKRLATLPLATYQAGETVFAAGSRTGRLLILRKGAVAIVKEAIEIAKVAMRPTCLRKTRSRFFTLRWFWHDVLTAPIRHSLS